MTRLLDGTPISFMIIAANIVVYLIITSRALNVERLSNSYRYTIGLGQYRRLLTSMFTHQEMWHLVLNMYSVVNLCAYVERSIGGKNFAVVYLLTGIGGGYLSCQVRHLMGRDSSGSIGASGAICGVLGYYIMGLVMHYGFGDVSGYIMSCIIPLALMTFNRRIDSIGHFTCLGCGLLLGVFL